MAVQFHRGPATHHADMLQPQLEVAGDEAPIGTDAEGWNLAPAEQAIYASGMYL